MDRKLAAVPRVAQDTAMFVRIDRDCRVTLEEPDIFNAFDVRVQVPRSDLKQVERALDGIGSLDGDAVVWVRRAWLREASGRAGVESWEKGFAAMLAYAARHGWTDPAADTVRAHIVWQEGAG
jgi:hypothetical protein